MTAHAAAEPKKRGRKKKVVEATGHETSMHEHESGHDDMAEHEAE